MADLQQEYGFFNYDEAVLESTGKYDREYTAEDFAKYFALFVGNGVFANPASQLMVKIAATKQTPYNVTVEPGWAFINGYWYHLQQKATLTIPVNTTVQTKYQRVVVRHNNTTREIGLAIVEAAGETLSPTRNDAIYDLVLAQVTVKSNVSTLSASDVKDLRPNSKYCGYVAGAINQIDAGTLYDNLTEQFNVWFESVKNQLDGNIATNLQKQIGSLENLNTTDKTNLVSSINEVLMVESNNKTSIDKKISELNTKLSSVVIVKPVKIYSATTISADSSADIYFSVPTVKGYKCILGIGGTCSNSYAVPVRASNLPESNGTLILHYRNISNVTTTVNDLYCNMIFVQQ